jgi:hypothetical protein
MGGGASFTFDGVTQGVSTAGKTIPLILAELAALFGFGPGVGNDLILPNLELVTPTHSVFAYQVPDPGLEVAVKLVEVPPVPSFSVAGYALLLTAMLGRLFLVHRRAAQAR